MPDPFNSLLTPCVSVILPMRDHRGFGVDAVTSWANAQTSDPQMFEIIVILDDTVKPLEHALQALLRPQDRLIAVPASDEIAQYDLGARQARGEYLFFTEPHCLAAPNAVTEIIAYFQTHTDDGFCAQSLPICRNRIADMEFRMFEEGWNTWSQEGHWCKVIIRGFGIRRSAYLASGGFDVRYGRFAEWLLAATLHVQGYRLGYAPHIIIQHAYGERLQLFDVFIREFTEGECLLRMERPREFCERFFGAPPEWDDFHEDHQDISRMLKGILLRQIRTRQGCTASLFGWQTATCAYMHLVFRELLGRRGAALSLTLSLWHAKARCYLWWLHPDRMYRAFQDYWQRTTTFYRIEFLLKHARPSEQAPASTPPIMSAISLGNAQNLFGFHGLEQHGGQHFRWSSPTAAIRMALPPAPYRIAIRLLPVRPIYVERELSIFFNQIPIRPIRYDQPTATLHLMIHPAMFNATMPNWLILLCSPLRIDIERRQLGLPIIAIESVEDLERNPSHEDI